MTAHAAASPVLDRPYPPRGRLHHRADDAAEPIGDAPAAAPVAAPAASRQDVERDRTALALAMSVAGAVGVFVAGAVALLLIAGGPSDDGTVDVLQSSHQVADGR